MIIQANFNNGYVTEREVFRFPDLAPPREINIEVEIWAIELAEGFANYYFGSKPYTNEDYEDYIDNYCDWGWHKITWEEYVEYCENWGIKPNELMED